MKFINKLFSNEPAPWKQWILRDAASFDTPSNGSTSYLWRIINDELTTYRSITYVNVLDGASTSFWFDHWLPASPLYACFPFCSFFHIPLGLMYRFRMFSKQGLICASDPN
jgi:hypothetical protein